ncbi:MAG: hypothetical protein Q8904_13520 [Bacteroidota bacterium]|nr:hypothetical protein [Bacteroidota bacterium]
MNHTFRLKNGEISFEGDKIIISDNAKSDKYFTLIIYLLGSVFGVINILKFNQTGEKFFYYSWLGLVILIFVFIVERFLKSTRSVILLEDVKSIKVNKRLIFMILDIKLKNNQIRRVLEIEDVEKLKNYIEKYQNGLTEK